MIKQYIHTKEFLYEVSVHYSEHLISKQVFKSCPTVFRPSIVLYRRRIRKCKQTNPVAMSHKKFASVSHKYQTIAVNMFWVFLAHAGALKKLLLARDSVASEDGKLNNYQ